MTTELTRVEEYRAIIISETILVAHASKHKRPDSNQPESFVRALLVMMLMLLPPLSSLLGDSHIFRTQHRGVCLFPIAHHGILLVRGNTDIGTFGHYLGHDTQSNESTKRNTNEQGIGTRIAQPVLGKGLAPFHGQKCFGNLRRSSGGLREHGDTLYGSTVGSFREDSSLPSLLVSGVPRRVCS